MKKTGKHVSEIPAMDDEDLSGSGRRMVLRILKAGQRVDRFTRRPNG